MTSVTTPAGHESRPRPVVELSVVLPCLDEAETLAICIRKAKASFATLGVHGEVVVADNGSADGSQALAAAEGARVIAVPTRGYGAALGAGIGAAQGEFVLMADADDSYALDDVGAFVEQLRDGADLVMGNRFRGGIATGAMPPLHRYLGNPVLSRVGRTLFDVPIGDFHCGIRAFRRDAILGLGMRCDGMEFASEMVVRAAVNGLDIREVPTTLRPDGRSRAPHLRTWHDGWRHLRLLLGLSPRWLMLYPGLVLTAVSAVGLLVLLGGQLEIGSLIFGVHTMLALATGVICGLQLIGFAVLSRAYAARIGLLPASRTLEHTLARLTLERGLVVGGLIALLGVVAFVVAVVVWGSRGFGDLDPADTMRVPILGMVLVVGGMQLAVGSFALSVLGDVPASD